MREYRHAHQPQVTVSIHTHTCQEKSLYGGGILSCANSHSLVILLTTFLLLYRHTSLSLSRAGVHSRTLFLKSNRLCVCYWIFSTQCCLVLRRLHRQFNKNIPLFSEITQNSATFLLLASFFIIVTDNTKTQLFYNFRLLETLILSGGYGFHKI
jgi:hypothetical protein